VYLFDEGLVRLCTTKYSAPCKKNLRKTCMHLTNYAINKKSKAYVEGKGKGKSNAEGSAKTTKGADAAAEGAAAEGGAEGGGEGSGEDFEFADGNKRSVRWLRKWLAAQVGML
jgi:hypothetical protein